MSINRASNCVKQNVREWHKEIGKSTITVGAFSKIDSSNMQKSREENSWNQQHNKSTGSNLHYWVLYPTTAKHTFLSYCRIFTKIDLIMGHRASPVAQMVKNPTVWETWDGKIPWRRAWQPTPVFLPGESPWTRGARQATVHGSQRVRNNLATKHSMGNKTHLNI